MKEVEAKKLGTEVLLEEMGAQRSEAEAQQVRVGGAGGRGFHHRIAPDTLAPVWRFIARDARMEFSTGIVLLLHYLP